MFPLSHKLETQQEFSRFFIDSLCFILLVLTVLIKKKVQQQDIFSLNSSNFVRFTNATFFCQLI